MYRESTQVRVIRNQFGEGIVYEDLASHRKVYAISTACMSIGSEFLSWANANREVMTGVEDAEAIVVLGCQVTDVAVLNDLRTLEGLMARYPGKVFYVGGCLATRFDVGLPPSVRRLAIMRVNHQFIEDRQLVDWAPPFWVENYQKGSGPGNLFRDMYPLRIGAGCRGQCSYCTIRVTRGEPYELVPDGCVMEYLWASERFPYTGSAHGGGVLLVADSPNGILLRKWLQLACLYGQPVTLRNVEPTVAIRIMPLLIHAALGGILSGLHVPIQSNDPETLTRMGRPVKDTLDFVQLVPRLRDLLGVVATNVIVDYRDRPDPVGLEQIFTHVSWNPYWDGRWDRDRAETRFAHYFPWAVTKGAV